MPNEIPDSTTTTDIKLTKSEKDALKALMKGPLKQVEGKAEKGEIKSSVADKLKAKKLVNVSMNGGDMTLYLSADDKVHIKELLKA